jgi:hypothetical protein
LPALLILQNTHQQRFILAPQVGCAGKPVRAGGTAAHFTARHQATVDKKKEEEKKKWYVSTYRLALLLFIYVFPVVKRLQVDCPLLIVDGEDEPEFSGNPRRF